MQTKGFQNQTSNQEHSNVPNRRNEKKYSCILVDFQDFSDSCMKSEKNVLSLSTNFQ